MLATRRNSGFAQSCGFDFNLKVSLASRVDERARLSEDVSELLSTFQSFLAAAAASKTKEGERVVDTASVIQARGLEKANRAKWVKS